MEALNIRYTFLYLTFVFAIIYLLQTLISHKLILGRQPITLKQNPHLPLRFSSDGIFKILQVADMHFGNGVVTRCRDVLPSELDGCSDLNTTRFLRRLIDEERPDFVAFTGDNIFGTSAADAAESLFEVFGPVMESRLPWAAILGNHDQESTMTREELMTLISLMDYSVSQINPAEDPSSPANARMVVDIDGFGNYYLRVNGAPGSHLANSSILSLYFLDSGDRATVNGRRTYGWIKESQLRWLRGVSQGFEGQKRDSKQSADLILPPAETPALAFFHIPVPEVRQLYFKEIVGQFQEAVACSAVNSGVLQTFVSMGDVKAVFMGHDHTNDFCGNLDGIWFCYGGGCGYHGYGRAGWPRRARIILAELGKGERAWTGVKRIRTWKRLDDEKMSKIDEQVLWDLNSSI
ncbi:putative inactive purple acid phosphatase 28 [Vitis vinifera]|uniref:Putative inactive purple acid phosphatase 28 n=1 Tax=Vitis vinifera TaxID=29760 RepID=A0A438BYT4_VITVI|nr:putative inactive purple acid phosphatase 28 [Vitis vinifera]